MAIRIESEHMAAEVNGVIVATARWSWYAAADGNGAWVPSTHPKRLFSRDQAISAMVLASLLASGRGDDDPHVISLRRELKW
jgi:hypothetical protein